MTFSLRNRLHLGLLLIVLAVVALVAVQLTVGLFDAPAVVLLANVTLLVGVVLAVIGLVQRSRVTG